MRPLFLRLPRRVALETYENARQKIARNMLEDGAISVYQLGSVSVVGVSDLDIFGVFPDAPTGDPLSGLTPDERYCAMHTPFALPVSLFGRLGLLFDTRGAEHFAGKDYGPPPAPAEAIKDPLTAEYLTGLALVLLRADSLRYYRVRGLLCGLNGLKHDASLSGLSPAGLARFTERLLCARELFGGGGRPVSVLPGLVREGLDVALRMLSLLGERRRSGKGAGFSLFPNERVVPSRTVFASASLGLVSSFLSAWGRRGREAAWLSGSFLLGLPPGLLSLVESGGEREAGKERIHAIGEYLAWESGSYSKLLTRTRFRPALGRGAELLFRFGAAGRPDPAPLR